MNISKISFELTGVDLLNEVNKLLHKEPFQSSVQILIDGQVLVSGTGHVANISTYQKGWLGGINFDAEFQVCVEASHKEVNPYDKVPFTAKDINL